MDRGTGIGDNLPIRGMFTTLSNWSWRDIAGTRHALPSIEHRRESTRNDPDSLLYLASSDDTSDSSTLVIDLEDLKESSWEPENIPREIGGWNWGAFLLAPLWVIAMRRLGWFTFLACCCVLLQLGFVETSILGVGLYVVSILVLGFAGNKLAWCTRSWSSVSAFKSTQAKWSNVGIVFWLTPYWIYIGMIIIHHYERLMR